MISYKLFPIFFFQAFFASEEARGWQGVITTFLKEVITFRVHNITIESGAISAQGGKPDQEDALLFYLGLNDHEWIQEDSVCLSKKNNPKNSVWFGVFDGHGEDGRGNKISSLVAECFKNFIEKQQQSISRFFFKSHPMKDVFSSISDTVKLHNFAKNHGTTACLCKISTNGLFSFYNLGDSRAIWGPGDQQCTKDHSQANQEERKRCQSLGAEVDEKGYFCMSGSDKKLAVSRGFGDTNLPFVSDIPDEYENINAQAVIIGCDGCFDKTDQAVLWNLYQKCLNTEGFSMTDTVLKIMFYILYCETVKITEWLEENEEKYNEITEWLEENEEKYNEITEWLEENEAKYNEITNNVDSDKEAFKDFIEAYKVRKDFIKEYNVWKDYLKLRNDITLNDITLNVGNTEDKDQKLIDIITENKNINEYANAFIKYRKDKVLHDNTSFILLRVQRQSSYKPINQERAILGLFLLILFFWQYKKYN